MCVKAEGGERFRGLREAADTGILGKGKLALLGQYPPTVDALIPAVSVSVSVSVSSPFSLNNEAGLALRLNTLTSSIPSAGKCTFFGVLGTVEHARRSGLGVEGAERARR